MSKTRAVLLQLLCLLACGTVVHSVQPSCRFAPRFSEQQLLSNASARLEYLRLVAYWEGKFHTPYISYNPKNGITYDGRAINYTTGEPCEPLHEFSAASKESVHVAMLALAVAGNQLAQIFCSPDDPTQGRDNAIQLLDLKMQTYETFNATYPGFGGFLPWISVNDSGISPLAPAWSNRVPSLDNGEWAWSLLAASWALDTAKEKSLAKKYRAYFDYLASTALIVFYEGAGKLRTVTGIKDPSSPVPQNVYYNLNCTIDTCYLDDPYEGELFAFLTDLYSDWAALNYSSSERDLIWVFKRGKLQSINLDTPSGEITVQRGWWFSSHEQWKYLELPYLDSAINARVFLNGERARTTFSAMNRYPGLFASVNDVTDGGETIPDYASAAGVQPVAFEQVLRNDIVTPYGSFPVFLANYTVGLAWYNNMLQGPRMQGIFGSTEAVAINGTMISPLVTWDSKITTMLAISGGISWINKKVLLSDERYQRFISVVDKEWSLAFPNLKGEDLGFQLPVTSIPAGLSNWQACSS